MPSLKSHGDNYKEVIFISHQEIEQTLGLKGLSEWSKNRLFLTSRLAAEQSMKRNMYFSYQNHHNLEVSPLLCASLQFPVLIFVQKPI